MDQRGGDNQLIRRVLVESGSLQPGYPLSNGSGDWENQVGHRDASHSTPVLNRSPLMCPLPRSAPCQVLGFTT